MNQDQPITPRPASTTESRIAAEEVGGRFLVWNERHPIVAILLVSLLAVAINCYPIIFCGNSYVSPLSMKGKMLVYDWWPPLPGMESWTSPSPDSLHSTHGSDVAAAILWGVPVGFIASRSLLDHGEIPLWNRYGHAGDTLIGQAISMLGDPLHLFVILGHGSAMAWDLKYVVAKFLFCVGFGLLILRLTGSRLLSLIFAALAAYCGAYFYINSHPVFFVLTYAPWILLTAIEWLSPGAGRCRWGLLWLLSNFACFNAGHVEAAVILIGGLNLAAVAYALIGCRDIVKSARILCRMAATTLLFLGLTAPVWISFLVSLDGAYTAHDEVTVAQLPPTLLCGAFDDLFYLLLRSNDSESALAPGTSLLILTGCSLSILRWRLLKKETFFWINTVAITLWGGCVFGWVPSFLLVEIPLLNRVGHVFTVFSYLLVVHLTIQCAYGFMSLGMTGSLRQATGNLACVGGVIAGLFVLYSIGYWHQPIPWHYFLCAAAGAVGAPLLFVLMKSRGRQTMVLGWIGIVVLGFIPNFRFGLYTFGNDAFLMRPGPRAILNAPSEAIENIRQDKSEAYRVIGLQMCLNGDYSAVYELEDIRSCAPLSNGDFIDLIRNFPGVEFSRDWVIQVVDPVRAQPLLNLLNVKYLLASPQVELAGQLDFRVTERSDFGVVENLQVWPRAFFANGVVSVDSNEQFTKHLLENGRQPFVAVSEEQMGKQPSVRQLATRVRPTVSAATNYKLLPNSTEFDIHASSPGVVCLTEGQAKDFTATANNEPREVLTVNRAFKGIYLDKPGDYHIRFTYRPRHWTLACVAFWISIGSVGIMVLMSIVHVTKKRSDPID